jgi:hypothetical protein
LICLLDRLPEELRSKTEGQEDKAGICLSQPPHQQRFSFGYGIDLATMKFDFRLRELYTDGAPKTEWPQLKASSKAGTCIDMKTRVVDVAALAKEVHATILNLESNMEHPERMYHDYVANSAELGLELNDPAYYFSVYPPKTSTNTTPRSRRLWTKAVRDGTTISIDTEVDVPTFSRAIGPPVPKPSSTPDAPRQGVIKPISVDSPAKSSNITFKNLPITPVDTGKPPSGGSIPSPCFFLKVAVDYKVPQPPINKDNAFAATDYVPTGNDFLVDLVFSIRKGQGRTKGNQQKLREIVINIPHTANNENGDKRTDALLKPEWDGGARMLGNQRFTPFIARSTTFTQVRLVPRSAQEHPVMRMDDLRTSEVSFRLSDVEVPVTKVKSWISIQAKPIPKREQLGFVNVNMFERYEVDGGRVYSVWNGDTMVIKRDKKDDGR